MEENTHKKKYVIHYKNEGRPEKTPIIKDRETAEKNASFLKWQGATSVRIVSQ